MLDMVAGIFTSQYTRHAPAITAYATKALQQAQTGGNRVNGKQKELLTQAIILKKEYSKVNRDTQIAQPNMSILQ